MITSRHLSFRREVDENCAVMGYYAASSGNFLPTFRDNLSFPSSGFQEFKIIPLDPIGFLWIPLGFLNPEYGIDRLSRNVSKKLPLLAA
jgi:hypothetical protein